MLNYIASLFLPAIAHAQAWTDTEVASTTSTLLANAKSLLINNIYLVMLFTLGLAVFFGLMGILFRALRRHGFRR